MLTIRPADAGRFHFTVTVKSPFANPADAMNSAKSGEFMTRMSIHLWTGVDDIERLVAAVQDLSRKMR